VTNPILYPENEPTPFWPLLYLCPETLQALFPYVVQAIDEDLVGGEVLSELTNLRHGIRAHLQHDNIWVD
jgi:hypothetical protein